VLNPLDGLRKYKLNMKASIVFSSNKYNYISHNYQASYGCSLRFSSIPEYNSAIINLTEVI
jgi:hypothetical protein